MLCMSTHQEAEKYRATNFFPLRADAVGTPVVLGLVKILGPKRVVDQSSPMLLHFGLALFRVDVGDDMMMKLVILKNIFIT